MEQETSFMPPTAEVGKDMIWGAVTRSHNMAWARTKAKQAMELA